MNRGAGFLKAYQWLVKLFSLGFAEENITFCRYRQVKLANTKI